MFERPRTARDAHLYDIYCEDVSLNTTFSKVLFNLYTGLPPTLPDLSHFNNAPLWCLFEAINEYTLDETKLPAPVVKARFYQKLKALYGDLKVLQRNQVRTVSHWTAEKRRDVMPLTKPLISQSTADLLDTEVAKLNIHVEGQIGRRKLISVSCVGENNYLRNVAGPLVDRILDAIEHKIASHTTNALQVTSYMNAPVPSAYDDLRPDIMLTTGTDMHFVSVKVKADSSQLALAFDEALKAGFFLTPLTGYSAIIMAVAGTEVLMGLHTLLPHPTDIEETSPVASRGPGAWMQSAKDSLPAMDENIRDAPQNLLNQQKPNETLKGELYRKSIAERNIKLNILSKYKSIVYPCYFDFDCIPNGSRFDSVFSKYLQFLVDPICFGVLSAAVSDAMYLQKSNKDCRVVMCHKSLVDRYRLRDCPDQFVAKLGVVRDFVLLGNVHAFFKSEIYKYTLHRFTITTEATGGSTASPSGRSTASASTDRAVHARLITQSNAGVQGTTLITYVYRKLEGLPLDSMPSIAQFVDLMGALIVLHDKEGVYHCDVRRPNIIVKGDSLRLIDYEYCLENGKALTNTKKRVPLQLQGIRTAQFFSEDILKNNIKGACSFTERRYVQLLDICSLFYFVGGVQGNLPSDGVEEVIFSSKFNEQFCDFIAREKKLKRTKYLRTTSEILQDIFQHIPSQETPDWNAVMDEAKRRNWVFSFIL